MDFNKLDQNDKMAAIGAVVVFLAGIISNWGGLFWLAILAAVGMAAVLFLPQLSSGTSLPGSKGTLMATLGFVAAGAGAIELLRYVGYFFDTLGRFSTIMFLVALVGAALMAWAGWQALQKEGGKWQFGNATTAPASAAATTVTQASDTAADTAQTVTDTASSTYDSAADAVDDRRPEA